MVSLSKTAARQHPATLLPIIFNMRNLMAMLFRLLRATVLDSAQVVQYVTNAGSLILNLLAIPKSMHKKYIYIKISMFMPKHQSSWDQRLVPSAMLPVPACEASSLA